MSVYLDSIPGLVYSYDEAAQAIDIRLGDDHRVTQVYGGNANEFVLPELGTGSYSDTVIVTIELLMGPSAAG